jgi:hypothetical protein
MGAFLGDADAVPSMLMASVAPRAMTQGRHIVIRDMNIPPFPSLTVEG